MILDTKKKSKINLMKTVANEIIKESKTIPGNQEYPCLHLPMSNRRTEGPSTWWSTGWCHPSTSASRSRGGSAAIRVWGKNWKVLNSAERSCKLNMLYPLLDKIWRRYSYCCNTSPNIWLLNHEWNIKTLKESEKN